ncbi:MAG: hypothetical protein LBG83_07700 [Oscillospiraceae bacterium]|jgi:hypothetical protein|nr:hypothetical protein [Oscillospiraceae bacterium]
MKSNRIIRIAILCAAAALILGSFALSLIWKQRQFPVAAAALSLVGIAISLEHHGKKWRAPLAVLRGLAVLVILATPLGWPLPALSFVPAVYPTVLQVLAIAVNVPLAAIGFQKSEGE